MKRTLALAFLAVALAAPPLRARPADPAEVQRLRAEAEAMQKRVESIRMLKFKSGVTTGIQDRAELRQFVLKELEKEMPDEKVRALSKAYAKIGFIPQGYDLKKALVDLYTEQIAAFYDPETKALYLVEHGGPEQEMVMAHELTHALQDQNFDLLRLHKAIENNDDRSLALTSIVEGDATVVMVVWLLREQAGVNIDVKSIPDIGMILSMTNKLGSLLGGDKGQEAFKNAPKVLTENMLFGYMQGASFCQRLMKKAPDGFEAVSRAFRDPPVSSEQILHPEKYAGEHRDEPIAVELPDLAGQMGEGWTLLEKNVMGEFNTALLFKEKLPAGEADRAAAGWGGDAWQALEGPAGEIVFVWQTVWDSKSDADEFMKTYLRFHKARADGSQVRIERPEETHVVTIVDGGGETVQKELVEAVKKGTKIRKGYGEPPLVAEAQKEPAELSETGPFAALKAPEGWKRTRPEESADAPVRTYAGPAGERLRIDASRAPADSIEKLIERREKALRAKEKTLDDYRVTYVAPERACVAYTRNGGRLRVVQIVALDGENVHSLTVSAPSERFEDALEAIESANPSLGPDLRASMAMPERARGGEKKREPTLY
jgi:hypothetical protein